MKEAYGDNGEAYASRYLTDWADKELSGLTDEQLQQMLRTEYGGMNEVVADVAVITGDKKYLELARRFSQRAILQPLLKSEDNLTGMHANTQIPKIIGFERIAEVGNDSSFNKAASFFWETVVHNRSVSIGGNSVREHFNPAENFISMLESEQGPETCNSNNMLKLTKMLFLENPKAKYLDFYERLIYNHILSSQHPDKGGFVYFTPIHPQHYRVYSTPQNAFWCCVGTGMENHSKYGELIYAHSGNDLYVNLFIASTLNWQQKGIIIRQQTAFPSEEGSVLSLQLKKAAKFTINIRKPVWLKGDNYTINVNGQSVKGDLVDGYVAIQRTWQNGDRIAISLPMRTYTDKLPDHSSWVSFLHGPIVLAGNTGTADMPGLMADDSRWAHIAGGPMYGLVKSSLLIADKSADLSLAIKQVKGDPLTFEINGLISQPEFQHLRLVPFYTVHDARYMLYWPVSTQDSVTQKRYEFDLLDRQYVALAARTEDQVSPGEQQPENDNKLFESMSETGNFGNLHWRRSAEYFGYTLRNSPQVKTLAITFYAKDKGKDFDVFANDQL